MADMVGSAVMRKGAHTYSGCRDNGYQKREKDVNNEAVL
jgi:hypothetical protein